MFLCINELHELLQNLHPPKKFTIEHSLKGLLLLDFLVKNVNGKITTDIYHKPTDTKQYLHFRSHHPKNCIKSIPYTLAHRIHTIIIDKNLKKKKTRHKKLHTTLHQSGYPTTLINKGLKLAEKIPLRELRNPKKHNNEKPLTYVTTNNKNNPELFPEIFKNLEEIENKDKIKEILDTTKIIKSQRQPKSMKRILTFSTFEKNNTRNYQMQK